MRIVSSATQRQKAVWGPRIKTTAALLLMFGISSNVAFAKGHIRQAQRKQAGVRSASVKNYKLDDQVTERATRGNPLHTTRVIVTLAPGAKLPAEFKKFAKGGKLDLINGQVLDLPNGLLKRLAADPDTFQIHYDRPAGKFNYRTSVTTGMRTVQESLGYTGAGIGVAVIDSGVASWHDDLTRNNTSTTYPYGNQRVTKFVDFVNGRALPYDDNGHGSHVAGIILGNGYDSYGEKSGAAPDASLISLKVLDANGQGTISNIIAALGWVAVNAKTYNIRVVNMSVGAGVHESYWTDPLTLAAKRVTDMGITVVVAAGNMGKNAAGLKQFGAINAPANAPWVLAVGASSTNGTLTRKDDTMASFSSRGPTFKDFDTKPDLVAPGVGTLSLAVPGSTFYASKSLYLVAGTRPTGAKAYLSLSGTSMAAPVVAGVVAAMLQANPTLTPNLIKAILQYTAEQYPGYKPLEQGAGFLNGLGAVRLAKFYATARPGARMPVQKAWSRHVIWGNHMLGRGYLNPLGNAWRTSVVWGSAKTLGMDGDNIVWGTACGSADCDNIVWGTADASGDNIVWGTALSAIGDNIVWGTMFDGDNIVWGTAAAGDNIVWGTDCGGADCDNIVWGTVSAADNQMWGTAADGDNIVWGTSADGDNIVWGTSSDSDETWGASGDDEDAALYPESLSEPLPDLASELGDVIVTSSTSTDATTGVSTTTVMTIDAVAGTTTTTVLTSTPVTDPLTGVTTTVTTSTTTTTVSGGL
ncbi:MAG: S8 family peptidase [Acidobacteriota bacterium]